MKKFIAIAVCTLLTGLSVFAATTGTLALQGNAIGVLSITIVPHAIASALDLSTNQSDLLVAGVNETSKRKAGYTVNLTSLNAGPGNVFTPKSADAANLDALAYTLNYGGVPVVLAGGTALITDATAKSPPPRSRQENQDFL